MSRYNSSSGRRLKQMKEGGGNEATSSDLNRSWPRKHIQHPEVVEDITSSRPVSRTQTKAFKADDIEDQRLAQLLEREMLQKSPGTYWHDIAGLGEAKALLQEAVVLPLLMPDYFKGIRRPLKAGFIFLEHLFLDPHFNKMLKFAKLSFCHFS